MKCIKPKQTYGAKLHLPNYKVKSIPVYLYYTC
uniref:Uncharacterized protein n=1 Tax=Anguilla anguilla TaxID=7936 RepID=A0A0E9PLQ3_ANGAN